MDILAAVERLARVVPHDGPDVHDPRYRLSQLFDENSCELMHPDDGTEVQTATGRINGAPVVAYCSDATKQGGAIGSAGALRVVEAIQIAVRHDRPVIGIWHSGGAKLTDGVESMDGCGQMLAAISRASGKVLQISLVVGPAAGAAAYGPALTDVIVMTPAARVFVTGPDVVRSATGEQIGTEELGGPEPHSRRSGVAHVSADSEADGYRRTRRLVGYFTRPGPIRPELLGDEADLRALLPTQARRTYDVRPLIRAIVDDDSAGDGGAFDELQPRWAPNLVIGFGRLSGLTIGVLANNPIRKGGCLDSLGAEKAARFVRMCDALGLPLLVIVDVPGHLPGIGEEWNGVVRRGAKLLHAFAEAVVPRVTLVTRKSHGCAYLAMNSRALGATAVYAWPDADFAVTSAASGLPGAEPAVAGAETAATSADHGVERADNGIERAISLGVLDEVITPRQTRRRLAETFAAAAPTRGRHSNIPL
jgi:acetyl-CoA/propionyl-CoA carboxylase carboxyl transferase subunit